MGRQEGCSLLPPGVPQGDALTTKYQVDLGDGFKAMYVNLTLTGEPVRHRYESPGIYRVSVRAENSAGQDEAVLFVQVTSESPRGVVVREGTGPQRTEQRPRQAPGSPEPPSPTA